MKKIITIIISMVFLSLSFNYASATEVTFDEKMKGIEGKYVISVQVNKWAKDPRYAEMNFPDTSIIHNVELEIKYEGRKEGSNTPIFSVYVDGEKTDNAKVGPSSSGGSGIFITMKGLPVPSLGEGRTIQGSAEFKYDKETSKYTYSTESKAVLISDGTNNLGNGSTTFEPAPVSEDDEALGEENNEVGEAGQIENAEGIEGQTGDTIDEGFVEEEEVTEEEAEEEKEEEAEEEKEEEPEEEKEEEPEEEEEPVIRGITFVKGQVQVKRAGSNEWIRARRNMPLNPGDTVRTLKNSYADLGYGTSEFSSVAGSDIRMNPLSVITVPDKTLKVEKKSKVRVVVDDAIKNVYSLLKKDEFEVETPSTVCGIRGTDFIIDVDEEGNTTFMLKEGSIEVNNIFDNSVVILKPGYKVLSSVNKTISEPEEMTEKDLALFNTDYRSGGNVLLFVGIGAIALVGIVGVIIVLKKRKQE